MAGVIGPPGFFVVGGWAGCRSLDEWGASGAMVVNAGALGGQAKGAGLRGVSSKRGPPGRVGGRSARGALVTRTRDTSVLYIPKMKMSWRAALSWRAAFSWRGRP